MVCWMRYINTVKKYLRNYDISDEQAKDILLDIEDEVGHNADLIKAIVDFEREALIKRLKKKRKKKAKGKHIAYA